MSVIGVVPQQAVHVCVKKSYDDLLSAEPLNTIGSGARRDPSNHPVVSDNSHFIGVLPDNSAIHDANKNKPKAISVQVSGLCSACIAYDADKKADSLVMGMPLLFDNRVGLYVDDAGSGQNPVGKFIDLVEEEYYPEHRTVQLNGNDYNFYHAIIHLNGIAQHNDTSANNKRYKLVAVVAEPVEGLTELVVSETSSESIVEAISTELSNLQKAIDEKQIEINKAFDNLSAAQNVKDTLEKKLITKQLEAANEQLIADEDRLKALKGADLVDDSEVSQLETKIENGQTSIKTMEDKNKKVAEELKTVNGRIDELQGTFVKLSTELKALSDKQSTISK